MKVLTIIGNGFDLGHGLPTEFDDFAASDPDIYKKKYGIFCSKNNSWRDIEGKYQQLLTGIMAGRDRLDIADEVEEVLESCDLSGSGEADCFRYSSDAWSGERRKISGFIRLLNEFERDFHRYLKTACGDRALAGLRPYESVRDILQKSRTVVSFNYTHTAEYLYGIENVIHIHGDIDSRIVIGSGALESIKKTRIDTEYPDAEQFAPGRDGRTEMKRYYQKNADGELVEKQSVQQFFSEVETAASEKEADLFSLLEEKNKDALLLRRQVIGMLRAETYDQVYIIGHSLGEADHSVFDAVTGDASVTCYYHDRTDRTEKEKALEQLGLKYSLEKDSEIYQPGRRPPDL